MEEARKQILKKKNKNNLKKTLESKFSYEAEAITFSIEFCICRWLSVKTAEVLYNDHANIRMWLPGSQSPSSHPPLLYLHIPAFPLHQHQLLYNLCNEFWPGADSLPLLQAAAEVPEDQVLPIHKENSWPEASDQLCLYIL